LTTPAPLNVLFSPMEAERMARREWQDPSVLSRESTKGPEWYIRYRVKMLKGGKIVRKERWHVLGLCSEMTKRQAEREKDRILREVNGQVYTVKSQIAFADVARAFRENHIPNIGEPSQKTYKQHMHAYIEPAFKDLRLCDIDTLKVEQLFATMERSGLSRATRSTTKGILTAIWGCARRWKWIDESPVTAARIGGGPRKVRECRVPTLADVGRLMDACEGDVPILIETLYMTGMRISEAAGLLVSDLDFERGRVCVRRRNCRGSVGQTKSEAGTRDLGLGGVAGKLLGHVQGKAASDPVFTWHGAPIVDNTLLANYVSPIMVKLGMKFPGFGWHTFRRLHLSLMALNGLSLFDLRQQAGHADLRTTQKYIADDVNRRAEAVKALPFLVRRGA
jgi:integrase